MASSPQHEPTMEEILASIRKIISEDSSESAPAPAPQPPPVAAAPVPQAKAPEDDVLELTQEIAPAEPKQAADEIVFESVEEEPAPAPQPAAAGSEIFSEKTRRAIDDAFSKLDQPEEPPAAKPAASPALAGFGRVTVEGDSVEAVFERAVRDAVGPHIDAWMGDQKDALLAAMKPLIRDWMDEHFPAILEGAVREEVARAVKARGKR